MPSNNTSNRLGGQHRTSADLESIYSAALKAVEGDNYDDLSQLLCQGDLDLLDKESLGSLIFKACESSAPLVFATTLISYCGPYVNFTSPDQACSCLMMAAKNDNRKLVDLLVQVGAKVNATDLYGWTALFYACYFGSVDCVQALIECGAQVNLVDRDDMSCLIWAAGRGHEPVVELLLKHKAPVNVADRYNTSALIWACRKGNSRIAEMLLNNGARINDQGMYGWTPLLVAVKGNHLETTKLLLSYKPNLSICDGAKMSPLMIACQEGFKEIAVELIGRGASVNQPDKLGNTPLILATAAKCTELVEPLVKAGAYVEHLNQSGRNAVHWSIIRDDQDSFRLFLELGIDMNLTNNDGESYHMLATKHRSSKVLELLQHTVEPAHH